MAWESKRGRPAQRRGRAFVTDASERVALHTIRCLGRAGIEAVALEVAERAAHCCSFASRYTSDKRVLPGPLDRQRTNRGQTLGDAQPGDVLIPVCLNSLLRTVENRDELSAAFSTLLPSRAALLQANDKWELHQMAADCAVAAPPSWCPEDEVELEELADNLPFPLIVKFRHDQGVYLGPADRYAKVTSRQALLSVWRRFHEIQPRPIIQSYVRGEGYGFEALYDRDHRCVASFQHRRLVECPPEGGPSAVCESVRIPQLEEYGRRLLDALKWTGVAMVEFRRCSDTGRFYLLEINPRFWGSVALSELAGVNFPALYFRCARDEQVSTPTYREGVRLRLMPTYLASGLMSLRRGGIRKALSNLRYLFDPRVHEGLLTLDDPRGSWAYVRTNLLRGGSEDG